VSQFLFFQKSQILFKDEDCATTSEWKLVSPPEGYEQCHVIDKIQTIQCCDNCQPGNVQPSTLQLHCETGIESIIYYMPTSCVCE